MYICLNLTEEIYEIRKTVNSNRCGAAHTGSYLGVTNKFAFTQGQIEKTTHMWVCLNTNMCVHTLNIKSDTLVYETLHTGKIHTQGN